MISNTSCVQFNPYNSGEDVVYGKVLYRIECQFSSTDMAPENSNNSNNNSKHLLEAYSIIDGN